MKKIKTGPMIEEYAAIHDVTVDAVVSWIDEYVNGDPMPHQEKTPEERLSAIRGYIEAMVLDSTTRRIKRQIKEAA